MFSWFPLFLPVPPLSSFRLEKVSELILEIARCVEDDQVHYKRTVKYENNDL
jgi:hypothetical protein